MKEVEPSVTALRVAGRRAAHQLFDEPKVFLDPYAVPILGAAEAARLAASGWRERGPLSTALRAWMVARSRFAEDELARARERGTEQYVILGAGLDTFAYRHPPDERPLTVFEVDHPATQRWKRARLAEAGIPVPPSVRYVATNFETGRLADDLAAVGWDRSTPTFFAWLGVTMYLTSAATGSMLNFLGATPPGGGVALDYFVRGGPRSPVERLARGGIALWVARAGEPFRSSFAPGELAGRLRGLGFRAVLDLGRDEVNARYFAGRSDRLRVGSTAIRLMGAER
jgi:methyltransferase (TIGR00027 family)